MFLIVYPLFEGTQNMFKNFIWHLQKNLISIWHSLLFLSWHKKSNRSGGRKRKSRNPKLACGSDNRIS